MFFILGLLVVVKKPLRKQAVLMLMLTYTVLVLCVLFCFLTGVGADSKHLLHRRFLQKQLLDDSAATR